MHTLHVYVQSKSANTSGFLWSNRKSNHVLARKIFMCIQHAVYRTRRYVFFRLALLKSKIPFYSSCNVDILFCGNYYSTKFVQAMILVYFQRICNMQLYSPFDVLASNSLTFRTKETYKLWSSSKENKKKNEWR